MESAADLYCQICQKKYQYVDTAPKCLSCGHVFCTTCITNLNTTRIKCPKCYANISILTPEDIDTINLSVPKSPGLASKTPAVEDTRGPTSLSKEEEKRHDKESAKASALEEGLGKEHTKAPVMEECSGGSEKEHIQSSVLGKGQSKEHTNALIMENVSGKEQVKTTFMEKGQGKEHIKAPIMAESFGIEHTKTSVLEVPRKEETKAEVLEKGKEHIEAPILEDWTSKEQTTSKVSDIGQNNTLSSLSTNDSFKQPRKNHNLNPRIVVCSAEQSQTMLKNESGKEPKEHCIPESSLDTNQEVVSAPKKEFSQEVSFQSSSLVRGIIVGQNRDQSDINEISTKYSSVIHHDHPCDNNSIPETHDDCKPPSTDVNSKVVSRNSSDQPVNIHSLAPEVIHYSSEESDRSLHNESAKEDHEFLKPPCDSKKERSKEDFHESPETKQKSSYLSKRELDKELSILSSNLVRLVTSGQNQDFSDIESESTKDSIKVHHSDSIDFSHMPLTPNVSKPPSIEESFEETKSNDLQKFIDQIQILHEVMETVDDAILTMKVEKEQHESSKQSLIQRLKEEEEEIEASNLKVKEALVKKTLVQEMAETLKEMEEEIARVQKLDVLKTTVEKTSDTMTAAEVLGTQTELYYMQLLLSKNVHKPEYLERMMDLGVQVCAVQQVEGEWRWAEISLLDSLIHVHSLQTQPPGPDCRTLPWSCLQGMMNKEKTRTFMDIRIAGKHEGRVYFSMFGDTPRAKQFVLLSSGEHKHCYRSVKMKQLGNQDQPGEYVSFHGPKNPKGSPIRGVVHGISQGGIHTRRKAAGLLAGAALSHRQRTLFVVYLVPDLDEDTTGAFGEVTQGLEILKKASRHEPIHEVEVEDCGLVIPLISSTS